MYLFTIHIPSLGCRNCTSVRPYPKATKRFLVYSFESIPSTLVEWETLSNFSPSEIVFIAVCRTIANESLPNWTLKGKSFLLLARVMKVLAAFSGLPINGTPPSVPFPISMERCFFAGELSVSYAGWRGRVVIFLQSVLKPPGWIIVAWMFQCGDISFLRDSVNPSNAARKKDLKYESENRRRYISSSQMHTKLGGNIIRDCGLGGISSSTADVENMATVAWRINLTENTDRLGGVVNACSGV